MEAQKGNFGVIQEDFDFLMADGGPRCGILGQSGGILSSCWQMEAQDVEFWGNVEKFQVPVGRRKPKKVIWGNLGGY